MTLRRIVGMRLAQLRLQSGLSQKRLAELSDVNVGTLRSMERGTHATSIDTVELVASALGVNASSLFMEGSSDGIGRVASTIPTER